MEFKKHLDLHGSHAFLSASKYHWINYDQDKLDRVFRLSQAAKRGTELHKLAHDLIRAGVTLERNSTTLSLYVNDAIGFRMAPEQTLYYSRNCYGTVDAISFRKNKLRIHDLKTGVTPGSVDQLKVYAALFCLEYSFKPFDIEIELRLYQNDDTIVFEADPADIVRIMSTIQVWDDRIEQLRKENEQW